MDKKKNIPEIRFKSFEEEWACCYLEQACTHFKGFAFQSKDYSSAGRRIIRVSDMGYDYIKNKDKAIYIDEDKAEEYSSWKLLNNDLIITTVGSKPPMYNSLVGRTIIVESKDQNSLLNQNAVCLRANEHLEQLFFNVLFKSKEYISFVELIIRGNANQGSIALADLFKYEFKHPKSLLEQKQIGTFFQNLDNLITLHQQKYDKLVILKKAMLVKMFPKYGALVPEIRFKGFSEDWVEKEIDEVANRFDNLRIPITSNLRIKGTTPYYGANGIQDYVEGHTHEGEFILVAEDGANDLKNYPVQYVRGKIWVNNHAHVLQAKKNIADNKFLKRAISITNIEPFLVGGGRAKLNAEIMMKINIFIPINIKEQKQIGNYFENLENQMALHKTQFVKLNNIKKACFSKMFVAQE
jgi:type I restriction enzyme S subunit